MNKLEKIKPNKSVVIQQYWMNKNEIVGGIS